jgi:hypothetical protein
MMSACAIQRLFRSCDELSIVADLDPEDDLNGSHARLSSTSTLAGL